jgi:hypothetical protein
MDNIKQIHAEYLKGKSLKELAEEMNIFPQKINYYFKKNNLPLLKSFKTLDTSYFKTIDTPEKAYFLGLLYSDGNVKGRAATIALQERDRHILEEFKKAIKSNNKLRLIPKKKEHHANQYVLQISSVEIVGDLIELGCIPKKANVLASLPKINKELYKYFILGYFDGDGTILQSKKKSKSVRWSITGNYDFLLEIRNVLDSLNINRTTDNLHQCGLKSKYTLDYTNLQSCEELFELFYDFESPYLFRKYESFKKYLKEYGGNRNLYCKIEQKDLEGNLIKIWDSMADIKKDLNIKHTSKIYKCLYGLHKTSMNYIWTYKKD